MLYELSIQNFWMPVKVWVAEEVFEEQDWRRKQQNNKQEEEEEPKQKQEEKGYPFLLPACFQVPSHQIGCKWGAHLVPC